MARDEGGSPGFVHGMRLSRFTAHVRAKRITRMAKPPLGEAQRLDVLQVGALLAAGRRGGRGVALEAGAGGHQRRLDPGVVPGVGNEGDLEFHPAAESVRGAVAVAIDEVAGPGDAEAVLAQQPLVELHLPLVGDLPVGVDADLFVLGGGLVVGDDELARAEIDPQVVDRARQQEAGVLVQEADALEVLPPFIQLLVVEGHGVDVLPQHVGMRLAEGAIMVEFLLQQVVDGDVEVERRAGRRIDTEAAVDVEAARALEEVLEPVPAQLEGLARAGREDVPLTHGARRACARRGASRRGWDSAWSGRGSSQVRALRAKPDYASGRRGRAMRAARQHGPKPARAPGKRGKPWPA